MALIGQLSIERLIFSGRKERKKEGRKEKCLVEDEEENDGATSSIFLGDSPYEITIHVSRLYLEKDVHAAAT